MNRELRERMAQAEDASGGNVGAGCQDESDFEKDAARYRWLRTHSCVTGCGHETIEFGPGFNQTKPYLLDAAIDDAMRYPIVGVGGQETTGG